MFCWTFFVLIGNGRRVIVDRVRADDLRTACLQWAQVIETDEFIPTRWRRMAAWGLPTDAEHEFASRADLEEVWCFHCTFGIADNELPEAWGGNHPMVWVVKTVGRKGDGGQKRGRR